VRVLTKLNSFLLIITWNVISSPQPCLSEFMASERSIKLNFPSDWLFLSFPPPLINDPNTQVHGVNVVLINFTPQLSIRNSINFVHEIDSNIAILLNAIFILFDIVSLYSNIPSLYSLDIMKHIQILTLLNSYLVSTIPIVNSRSIFYTENDSVDCFLLARHNFEYWINDVPM